MALKLLSENGEVFEAYDMDIDCPIDDLNPGDTIFCHEDESLYLVLPEELVHAFDTLIETSCSQVFGNSQDLCRTWLNTLHDEDEL